MREVLLACGLMSIPFVCVYFYYCVLIMALPSYETATNDAMIKRTQVGLCEPEFSFVFLVPCLNEAKVIARTVEAILSLPNRRVLIVVIDDASNDGTPEVVRAIAHPRVRVFQRRMPDAQQGKGEALNACYRYLSRGAAKLGLSSSRVLVCVIDGDGRPSDNLLSSAALAFVDPSVGVAQATIRITNRQHLFPLMQDVEFAVTISARQNARQYFGNVGLGGNGQFARLSALQTLGEKPWTKCLLEDFDIGLRLLLAGFDISFLADAHVAQQGLTSVRRFIRQRARWVQGNVQCMRYIGAISRSKLPRHAKLDVYYFLLQPWLNWLGTFIEAASMWAMIAVVITRPTWLMHHSRGLTALQLGLWLLGLFCPGLLWTWQYWHRCQGCSGWRSLLVALYFPCYNMLCIPSVWLAVFRHFTGRNRWQKTERLQDLHRRMRTRLCRA